MSKLKTQNGYLITTDSGKNINITNDGCVNLHDAALLFNIHDIPLSLDVVPLRDAIAQTREYHLLNDFLKVVYKIYLADEGAEEQVRQQILLSNAADDEEEEDQNVQQTDEEISLVDNDEQQDDNIPPALPPMPAVIPGVGIPDRPLNEHRNLFSNAIKQKWYTPIQCRYRAERSCASIINAYNGKLNLDILQSYYFDRAVNQLIAYIPTLIHTMFDTINWNWIYMTKDAGGNPLLPYTPLLVYYLIDHQADFDETSPTCMYSLISNARNIFIPFATITTPPYNIDMNDIYIDRPDITTMRLPPAVIVNDRIPLAYYIINDLTYDVLYDRISIQFNSALYVNDGVNIQTIEDNLFANPRKACTVVDGGKYIRPTADNDHIFIHPAHTDNNTCTLNYMLHNHPYVIQQNDNNMWFTGKLVYDELLYIYLISAAPDPTIDLFEFNNIVMRRALTIDTWSHTINTRLNIYRDKIAPYLCTDGLLDGRAPLAYPDHREAYVQQTVNSAHARYDYYICSDDTTRERSYIYRDAAIQYLIDNNVINDDLSNLCVYNSPFNNMNGTNIAITQYALEMLMMYNDRHTIDLRCIYSTDDYDTPLYIKYLTNDFPDGLILYYIKPRVVGERHMKAIRLGTKHDRAFNDAIGANAFTYKPSCFAIKYNDVVKYYMKYTPNILDPHIVQVKNRKYVYILPYMIITGYIPNDLHDLVYISNADVKYGNDSLHDAIVRNGLTKDVYINTLYKLDVVHARDNVTHTEYITKLNYLYPGLFIKYVDRMFDGEYSNHKLCFTIPLIKYVTCVLSKSMSTKHISLKNLCVIQAHPTFKLIPVCTLLAHMPRHIRPFVIQPVNLHSPDKSIVDIIVNNVVTNGHNGLDEHLHKYTSNDRQRTNPLSLDLLDTIDAVLHLGNYGMYVGDYYHEIMPFYLALLAKMVISGCIDLNKVIYNGVQPFVIYFLSTCEIDDYIKTHLFDSNDVHLDYDDVIANPDNYDLTTLYYHSIEHGINIPYIHRILTSGIAHNLNLITYEVNDRLKYIDEASHIDTDLHTHAEANAYNVIIHDTNHIGYEEKLPLGVRDPFTYYTNKYCIKHYKLNAQEIAYDVNSMLAFNDRILHYLYYELIHKTVDDKDVFTFNDVMRFDAGTITYHFIHSDIVADANLSAQIANLLHTAVEDDALIRNLSDIRDPDNVINVDQFLDNRVILYYSPDRTLINAIPFMKHYFIERLACYPDDADKYHIDHIHDPLYTQIDNTMMYYALDVRMAHALCIDENYIHVDFNILYTNKDHAKQLVLVYLVNTVDRYKRPGVIFDVPGGARYNRDQFIANANHIDLNTVLFNDGVHPPERLTLNIKDRVFPEDAYFDAEYPMLFYDNNDIRHSHTMDDFKRIRTDAATGNVLPTSVAIDNLYIQDFGVHGTVNLHNYMMKYFTNYWLCRYYKYYRIEEPADPEIGNNNLFKLHIRLREYVVYNYVDFVRNFDVNDTVVHHLSPNTVYNEIRMNGNYEVVSLIDPIHDGDNLKNRLRDNNYEYNNLIQPPVPADVLNTMPLAPPPPRPPPGPPPALPPHIPPGGPHHGGPPPHIPPGGPHHGLHGGPIHVIPIASSKICVTPSGPPPADGTLGPSHSVPTPVADGAPHKDIPQLPTKPFRNAGDDVPYPRLNVADDNPVKNLNTYINSFYYRHSMIGPFHKDKCTPTIAQIFHTIEDDTDRLGHDLYSNYFIYLYHKVGNMNMFKEVSFVRLMFFKFITMLLRPTFSAIKPTLGRDIIKQLYYNHDGVDEHFIIKYLHDYQADYEWVDDGHGGLIPPANPEYILYTVDGRQINFNDLIHHPDAFDLSNIYIHTTELTKITERELRGDYIMPVDELNNDDFVKISDDGTCYIYNLIFRIVNSVFINTSLKYVVLKSLPIDLLYTHQDAGGAEVTTSYRDYINAGRGNNIDINRIKVMGDDGTPHQLDMFLRASFPTVFTLQYYIKYVYEHDNLDICKCTLYKDNPINVLNFIMLMYHNQPSFANYIDFRYIYYVCGGDYHNCVSLNDDYGRNDGRRANLDIVGKTHRLDELTNVSICLNARDITGTIALDHPVIKYIDYFSNTLHHDVREKHEVEPFIYTYIHELKNNGLIDDNLCYVDLQLDDTINIYNLTTMLLNYAVDIRRIDVNSIYFDNDVPKVYIHTCCLNDQYGIIHTLPNTFFNHFGRPYDAARFTDANITSIDFNDVYVPADRLPENYLYKCSYQPDVGLIPYMCFLLNQPDFIDIVNTLFIYMPSTPLIYNVLNRTHDDKYITLNEFMSNKNYAKDTIDEELIGIRTHNMDYSLHKYLMMYFPYIADSWWKSKILDIRYFNTHDNTFDDMSIGKQTILDHLLYNIVYMYTTANGELTIPPWRTSRKPRDRADAFTYMAVFPDLNLVGVTTISTFNHINYLTKFQSVLTVLDDFADARGVNRDDLVRDMTRYSYKYSDLIDTLDTLGVKEHQEVLSKSTSWRVFRGCMRLIAKACIRPILNTVHDPLVNIFNALLQQRTAERGPEFKSFMTISDALRNGSILLRPYCDFIANAQQFINANPAIIDNLNNYYNNTQFIEYALKIHKVIDVVDTERNNIDNRTTDIVNRCNTMGYRLQLLTLLMCNLHQTIRYLHLDERDARPPTDFNIKNFDACSLFKYIIEDERRAHQLHQTFFFTKLMTFMIKLKPGVIPDERIFTNVSYDRNQRVHINNAADADKSNTTLYQMMFNWVLTELRNHHTLGYQPVEITDKHLPDVELDFNYNINEKEIHPASKYNVEQALNEYKAELLNTLSGAAEGTENKPDYDPTKDTEILVFNLDSHFHKLITSLNYLRNFYIHVARKLDKFIHDIQTLHNHNPGMSLQDIKINISNIREILSESSEDYLDDNVRTNDGNIINVFMFKLRSIINLIKGNDLLRIRTDDSMTNIFKDKHRTSDGLPIPTIESITEYINDTVVDLESKVKIQMMVVVLRLILEVHARRKNKGLVGIIHPNYDRPDVIQKMINDVYVLFNDQVNSIHGVYNTTPINSYNPELPVMTNNKMFDYFNTYIETITTSSINFSISVRSCCMKDSLDPMPQLLDTEWIKGLPKWCATELNRCLLQYEMPNLEPLNTVITNFSNDIVGLSNDIDNQVNVVKDIFMNYNRELRDGNLVLDTAMPDDMRLSILADYKINNLLKVLYDRFKHDNIFQKLNAGAPTPTFNTFIREVIHDVDTYTLCDHEIVCFSDIIKLSKGCKEIHDRLTACYARSNTMVFNQHDNAEFARYNTIYELCRTILDSEFVQQARYTDKGRYTHPLVQIIISKQLDKDDIKGLKHSLEAIESKACNMDSLIFKGGMSNKKLQFIIMFIIGAVIMIAVVAAVVIVVNKYRKLNSKSDNT